MKRWHTLKTITLYALSIFLFWNVVIAFRAYRFTHFTTTKTAVAAKADMWDYIATRVSGSKYYKLPITATPTIPYTTVTLTTSDAMQLEAWFMPAANSKGTVVVMHGLAGNKQAMLPESYELIKAGYSVLSVDFRAHGNSQGNATTVGAKEATDVKAAYDYIKAQGESNIILYGASMGAASITSCLHQYETVKPSKIILDMPFNNFEKLMENFFATSKYPAQPTFTLFTFWASVFNNTWMFNVKPSDYVKSIKCPTLVQWGKLDNLVTQSCIDDVVDNISAKKVFKVYDNLGHQSFVQNNNDDWKKTVEQFLDK